MEAKIIVNEREREIKSKHPFCCAYVPTDSKYVNGDTVYAYHYCMLREVDYDDGYSTSYCCKIDKKDASENVACRHWELFNKGYVIKEEEYITSDF